MAPKQFADLEELASQYVLEQLSSDELPDIAESLILRGMQSPNLLRLLAVEKGESSECARKYFEHSLSELGQQMPTRERAALILATQIANQIIDGTIPPDVGAMTIWKDLVVKLEKTPPELWLFVSNSSAIEDCQSDAGFWGTDHSELISQCQLEIRQAAERLIRSQKQP